MVGETGIEPVTPGLEVLWLRSTRLYPCFLLSGITPCVHTGLTRFIVPVYTRA